jgi:hypothetical protein
MTDEPRTIEQDLQAVYVGLMTAAIDQGSAVDGLRALSSIREHIERLTQERDEARERRYALYQGVYQKQGQRIQALEAALPDPAKLDLLADWFDQDDANKGRGGVEVQGDLRRWARGIRNVLDNGEPS